MGGTDAAVGESVGLGVGGCVKGPSISISYSHVFRSTTVKAKAERYEAFVAVNVVELLGGLLESQSPPVYNCESSSESVLLYVPSG